MTSWFPIIELTFVAKNGIIAFFCIYLIWLSLTHGCYTNGANRRLKWIYWISEYKLPNPFYWNSVNQNRCLKLCQMMCVLTVKAICHTLWRSQDDVPIVKRTLCINVLHAKDFYTLNVFYHIILIVKSDFSEEEFFILDMRNVSNLKHMGLCNTINVFLWNLTR